MRRSVAKGQMYACRVAAVIKIIAGAIRISREVAGVELILHRGAEHSFLCTQLSEASPWTKKKRHGEKDRYRGNPRIAQSTTPSGNRIRFRFFGISSGYPIPYPARYPSESRPIIPPLAAYTIHTMARGNSGLPVRVQPETIMNTELEVLSYALGSRAKRLLLLPHWEGQSEALFSLRSAVIFLFNCFVGNKRC
jgi:hypothetical protein